MRRGKSAVAWRPVLRCAMGGIVALSSACGYYGLEEIHCDGTPGCVLVPACEPIEVDGDRDGNGVADGLECPPGAGELVMNGGFEEPLIGAGAAQYAFFANGTVPGWTSSDGVIEIWESGHRGIDSSRGIQHAEVAASSPAALYQDLGTVGGTVLRWTFHHRGREGADVLELRMGPPAAPEPLGRFTSDVGHWLEHTGTYQVPPDQTITRIELRAITPMDMIGNLVDEVSVVPVCAIDMDGDGCVDAAFRAAGEPSRRASALAGLPGDE